LDRQVRQSPLAPLEFGEVAGREGYVEVVEEVVVAGERNRPAPII
jgi:hypothetical protein